MTWTYDEQPPNKTENEISEELANSLSSALNQEGFGGEDDDDEDEEDEVDESSKRTSRREAQEDEEQVSTSE